MMSGRERDRPVMFVVEAVRSLQRLVDQFGELRLHPSGPAIDKVMRSRCVSADHGPLAAIRLVAPHAGFVPVQKSGSTVLSATLVPFPRPGHFSLPITMIAPEEGHLRRTHHHRPDDGHRSPPVVRKDKAWRSATPSVIFRRPGLMAVPPLG
jgi:hypothetical protein